MECAIRLLRVPSSSLTLPVTLSARYLRISSFISIPFLRLLSLSIDILVSKVGGKSSAESPHLNLESRRLSNPFISTGALSEVRISCFPSCCNWLNIWKKAFCVPTLSANS